MENNCVFCKKAFIKKQDSNYRDKKKVTVRVRSIKNVVTLQEALNELFQQTVLLTTELIMRCVAKIMNLLMIINCCR